MQEDYTLIAPLLTMLDQSGKTYDVEKIKRAYVYSASLHEGQFRQSGEAYIVHPISVAEIAAKLGLDTDSICAAFLHDTVEDCADKTSLEEVSRLFGGEVALIVDGVTKIQRMQNMQVEDQEERHMENIRKMLLAMSKDIRVIFIKLCDRLHNMRTLSAKKEERRRDIALETMHIYAPLAHRLGIQRIKQELENLSLIHLDPIGYDEVTEEIDRRYGQSRDFIEACRVKIEESLKENGIECEISGRVKSVYSLYRKMYTQQKSFHQIYDFYALRVIVRTELECYTVLGILHELFKSVPGRFKDYISTPKPNLYRSLHTTVFGRGGIPFEVQIRTREMHQVAEYGIAAHWKYKSGESSSEDIDRKLSWISKLLEADDSTRDPDEYIHTFKTDIFHDETFVFTPKGDVIALPQGSNVIDFAYAIHTAVGNKMVGARINGAIVPIDRVLQTGEIVEIITSSSSKGPSRDWLSMVTTGEARSKIRAWFKKEMRAENIEVGRAEVERELRRMGRAYTESELLQVAENLSRRIGITGAEDLFNTLGFGGLSISRISGKLKDEFERVVKPPETVPAVEVDPSRVVANPKSVKRGSGVVVDGQRGCQVKFARCCNPLPGDEIIGFVSRGFGISVHKRDCPNAVLGTQDSYQKDRWLPAAWEEESEMGAGGLYEAMLMIEMEERIGVLAEITAVIADMKVSILQINTVNTDGRTAVTLTVGCKNVSHYNSIVARLRGIPSVISIARGYKGATR